MCHCNGVCTRKGIASSGRVNDLDLSPWNDVAVLRLRLLLCGLVEDALVKLCQYLNRFERFKGTYLAAESDDYVLHSARNEDGCNFVP
jgi:hypothetical protein